MRVFFSFLIGFLFVLFGAYSAALYEPVEPQKDVACVIPKGVEVETSGAFLPGELTRWYSRFVSTWSATGRNERLKSFSYCEKNMPLSRDGLRTCPGYESFIDFC